MVGPGGHPVDIENAAPAVTPPASAEPGDTTGHAAVSDKPRGGADMRATSTDPSMTGYSSEQCGPSPYSTQRRSHPLVARIRKHIPPTVQKQWSRVYTYLKGPEPPRQWKIRPVLPAIQQVPLRLVDKVCPRQWQRVIALGLFYICWIATFAAVLRKSSVGQDVNGYGQPIRVACGAAFWYASLTVCSALLVC